MRRLALSWCVVAVALLATSVPADADVFGPISLVSQGALGGGELLQAEYAHDPAISGNGQYVAFDGSIGGVTGVWRRDLATGAIEQVAGGDAELPSISADGQYVSFTSNEGLSLPEVSHGRLDASPHAEAVNVYVRNMDEQPASSESEEAARPAQERAFTIVSAVNGSEEPLTYAGGSPTKTGSSAVGRSAIDAAGNEVAFVTTAVSNLVRYPQIEKEEEEKGETPKPHMPRLQVAVRYLGTHETVLVSRCFVRCEPSAEPAVQSEESSQTYGAVYAGHSVLFEPPPAYGAYSLSPPPGASISADGSTVAWMGEDIGQQAPLLSEETRNPHYTEPLWRRIEPGSETATERVTGGSDPSSPACVASGHGTLEEKPSPADPCQGPFVVEEQSEASGIINGTGAQTGDFVPRLSEHGNLVAFVSEAPLVTSKENFGRTKSGQESDLYVANMAPGLTRDQALTQVTELAGGEGSGLADTAPIFDFDISPDGSQVAFATVRTRFPLGSPAFVSTPAGEPGMNELYDADLADGTLTRVTHGYQGPDEAGEHTHNPAPAGKDPYEEQPGDGALSPSFTDNGDTLAFSSTASNLVFGDGNSPPLGLPQTGSYDGSDAFTVERVVFGATPTPDEASAAPEPGFAPAWNIGVTALSRANGSVLLYVQAPGAGSLRAGAHGAVVVASAGGAHGARRTHHASRARVKKKAVATRTVAASTTDTKSAGLATLTLTLTPAYAALAGERGGLSATVTVTFSAPGHGSLQETVPVTFLRERKSANAKQGAKGGSLEKRGRSSTKAGRR